MIRSLFDKDCFADSLERIDSIAPGTIPAWGKMSAAQMFAHCKEAQLVANGQKEFKPNFVARLLRRFIMKGVFGPKPYPRSSPTAPQYLVDHAVDFETEKAALLKALTYFHQMSDEEIASVRHGLFGVVPKEDLGWGMYKHLDHHLTQFGV